jgi:hypothetical protein
MILLCLVIAAACVGTHIVINALLSHFTSYNAEDWYEELHDVDELFRPVKNWKTHLAKPLFACVTCMASIWGTFYYILLAPIHLREWELVFCYVPTLMIVALLNTWIYKMYNR